MKETIGILPQFYRWASFFLVATSLLIPSDAGRGGIFHPKALILLLGSGVWVLYCLGATKISRRGVSYLALVGFSLFFLLLTLAVRIFREGMIPVTALDQGKVILATLFVFSFLSFGYGEGLFSLASFLRWVLCSNGVYCAGKVALFGAHFLGMLDVKSLFELLGIRFMTMDLATSMVRLQTSLDIVTPFFFFFALQEGVLGLSWRLPFRRVYLVVGVLSTFLSFSRFLLGIIVLSCVLHGLCLPFVKRWWGLLLCSLLLVFVGAAVGQERMHSALHLRFLSSANALSDSIRRDQSGAMVKEIYRQPFVGKGLGGYTEEVIRAVEPSLWYLYEVQWLSLAMQFGIIGVSCLALGAFSVILDFLRVPLTRVKLSFVLLYLAWLLAGFTNPYLLSLTSGVLYALFHMMGRGLRYPTIAEANPSFEVA